MKKSNLTDMAKNILGNGGTYSHAHEEEVKQGFSVVESKAIEVIEEPAEKKPIVKKADSQARQILTMCENRERNGIEIRMTVPAYKGSSLNNRLRAAKFRFTKSMNDPRWYAKLNEYTLETALQLVSDFTE